MSLKNEVIPNQTYRPNRITKDWSVLLFNTHFHAINIWDFDEDFLVVVTEKKIEFRGESVIVAHLGVSELSEVSREG